MMERWRALYSRTLSFLRGLERIPVLLGDEALRRLRESPRYDDPKSLIRSGYKMFSQNEEDGILKEIFNRIGVTNKLFVEFGAGSGLENNTLALLFEGWKGLWIEADGKSVRRIQKNFKKVLGDGTLKVVRSFITRENIDGLISGAVREQEIDLLSIDMDGNDAHVFNAIKCVRPRVVVIEYNSKFPPPVLFCMDYDEKHVWNKDELFGASLKYLEIEFRRKGYRLVGCNLTGSNAFFVRSELTGDKFLEPFSAENHYEPARYHLTAFPSGHRPSFKTLEKSLAARSAA